MSNHNMLIPNLMVEDVKKTVRFYHDVLDFELMAAVIDMQAGMTESNMVLDITDDKSLDWANVKRGEVELMFQSRASLSSEIPELSEAVIGASQTLYLRCHGLEGFYEQIKEGIEILKKPHDKFYGMREFYAKDLNGYILCFAEEVKISKA